MKGKLFFIIALLLVQTITGQVTANPPAPIELCDQNNPGDEIEPFDLTSREAEIVGSQEGLTVTYHESFTDAEAGINPIFDPTNYLNLANPQLVFPRAENGIGEYDTTFLDLIVLPVPSPNTPTPLEVCDNDNDGFALFFLSDKDDEIIGGEPNITVTYHETQVDAESGFNPLASPYSNVVPFVQTVYARAENLNNCYTIVELELVVRNIPLPGQPNNVFIDEGDGDGMAIFDLTVNTPILELGTPGAIVTYFETENDAISDVNPILDPTAYANTSNPQTMYANVKSPEDCLAIARFIIATDSPLLLDNDNDGLPSVVEDLNVNGNLDDDDTDNNSVPNYLDDDDDGDMTPTIQEDYNNNGSPTDDDTNNNLLPDYLDPDVNLDLETFNVAEVALYPNPTDGIVNLNFQRITSEVEVAVLSVGGQLLKSLRWTAAEEFMLIDLSNQSAGIYFVRITSEGQTTIKKIILK